jgi:hypothetical protein
MCRSIKTLRFLEHPASEQEINEAALQFVRKVSGYRKPSRANQAAFDAAVHQIAVTTQELLNSLVISGEIYPQDGKLRD